MTRVLLGVLALVLSGGCSFPDERASSEPSGTTANEGASGESVLVAVASNFVATLQQLEVEFEATHAHQLEIASGSTGKLYAQIISGAPYDVFLSADAQRPRLLEDRDMAEQRFAYAQGRLVLWSVSSSATATDSLQQALGASGLRRVALANPALAPYGRAAKQTLVGLGLFESLRPKLILAENIGQAHVMVATGNAELGFTAQSYLQAHRANVSDDQQEMIHAWPIPAALHEPIVQEAVWLQVAASNPAAEAFAEFLQSDSARKIIRSAGYDLPSI